MAHLGIRQVELACQFLDALGLETDVGLQPGDVTQVLEVLSALLLELFTLEGCGVRTILRDACELVQGSLRSDSHGDQGSLPRQVVQLYLLNDADKLVALRRLKRAARHNIVQVFDTQRLEQELNLHFYLFRRVLEVWLLADLVDLAQDLKQPVDPRVRNLENLRAVRFFQDSAHKGNHQFSVVVCKPLKQKLLHVKLFRQDGSARGQGQRSNKLTKCAQILLDQIGHVLLLVL